MDPKLQAFLIRLAAALADPEHLAEHLEPADIARLGAAFGLPKPPPRPDPVRLLTRV